MRCSSDMRRTVILRYLSQHVSHSVIHHINAAEYAKNVFSYYFDVQDAEELLNGQAENVGESSNSFND